MYEGQRKRRLEYHFGGDESRWREAAEKISIYENYLRSVSQRELLKIVNNEVVFLTGALEADFDGWAQKDFWFLPDAITLSLGADTDFYTWWGVAEFPDLSDFAFHYRRRRELVLRAISSGELWDPVSPIYFVSWAWRVGLAIPSKLSGMFEKNFPDSERFYQPLAAMPVRNWGLDETVSEKDKLISELRREVRSLRSVQQTIVAERVRDQNELTTRERNTLLKMIFGIAVTRYRYDSAALRSDAVRRIAGDLDQAGVHIDDDTIRSWIKKAVQLVSEKGKK